MARGMKFRNGNFVPWAMAHLAHCLQILGRYCIRTAGGISPDVPEGSKLTQCAGAQDSAPTQHLGQLFFRMRI